MTSFSDAARALRTLLQAENAALRSAPVTVAALHPDKEKAADAFTQAAATAPKSYYNQALAEQLRELAAENAALLTRAIAVQTRVIGIVTTAALASARAAEHAGYDQHGADPDAAPVALAVMHRA